jgi:hypothetical protein
MRRYAFPAAVGLLVATVATANAGAGLPMVASLQVGPHQAALHNDSPALRKGGNTLTVEIPTLPAGATVGLAFRGPAGQVLSVPLRPVTVLPGGERDSHGAGGTAGATVATSSQSPAPAMDHGHGAASTHGAAQGAMPAAASAAGGFLGRGTVQVPHAGRWHAQLSIRDPDGALVDAESPLDIVDGGPNPLYLGTTGGLMAGTLLFGAIRRRRERRERQLPAATTAQARPSAAPRPTAR